MKRLIALAFAVMLMLTACAHTNVLTSSGVSDTASDDEIVSMEVPLEENKETLPGQPEAEDTQTPLIEQADPEQEVLVQQPDEEQEPTEQEPTEQEPIQEDEVDEQEPTQEDELTEQEDQPNRLVTAPIVLATADKKKNSSPRPSYDLAELGLFEMGVSDLKDKTINMFISDKSAFLAGALDEKAWLEALKEEYGVTVNYTVRQSKTLYPAQYITQLAGKDIDVISTDINDMASSLGLIKSSKDFFDQLESTPFSGKVFNSTNGKVFTAKGDAKMLWYNTEIILDDSPYQLYKQDSFTTDVMPVVKLAVTNKDAKMIECNNWISFGSAAGTQISGIADTSVRISLTSENSIKAFSEFATIFESEKSEGSFAKGTAAFAFTNTPSGKIKLSFAPIPKVGQEGNYVAEFTGKGLGLSKTVSDDNADIAVLFMTLWSARYTEARVDLLMHDYSLGFEKTLDYIDACETYGLLTNIDSVLTSYFEGDAVPSTLYGTTDAVYNDFVLAYKRANLLNSRY